MRRIGKHRVAFSVLLAIGLSACTANGTLQLPAETSATYPPAVFSHRVGTSHVVLYWNCTRPEPGLLRLEGVAQQAGSSQPIRFLEMELAGVDARELYVSQAFAALVDILLHTNQISPFGLDLRTTGTEVRFDLFYRYHFQDNGHPFVAGPLVGWSRLSAQNQQFMARDVCSETQHRVR